MGRESGNALFLILIAVALFAALSYAVTQSGRGGGDISREQTQILAAQIVQYIGSVEQAVQRMTLTGVAEDQLDFYSQQRLHGNDVVRDMDNTLCTDTSCQVFHPDGGGVTYQHFESAGETDPLPAGYGGTDLKPGHHLATITPINGVGTALPEIVIEFRAIDPKVCQEINRHFGLPAELSGEGYRWLFEGDPTAELASNVATANMWGGAAAAPELEGARTFCVDAAADAHDGFYLFHVLVAR
ncbi:MAG: hypothetical protein ACQEQL_07085 [Pseudomonadota bacterium]